MRAKPESNRFGSLGQSERALEPHTFLIMSFATFITGKKMQLSEFNFSWGQTGF